MSLRLGSLILFGAVVLATAAPAGARNIVLSNDDGLTANVKALYDALKADGHDVIVVVPCAQQSGMGAALRPMRPLQPLASDCVNGAARAGDPGAGVMTRADLGPDFHYLDGTPVMATLYGIDVLAQARWGRAPDLVLSGPNIGLNAGTILISSGTVSNAQYAMIRGIPAIALSAVEQSESGPDLRNPLATSVAGKTMELIRQLDARADDGPLLPPGLGLNVNFPASVETAQWRMSRIGSYSPYELRFVEDLGRATGRQTTSPMPGLLFSRATGEPAAEQGEDEAAVARAAISVSVIQIAYDAPADSRSQVSQTLAPLISQ